MESNNNFDIYTNKLLNSITKLKLNLVDNNDIVNDLKKIIKYSKKIKSNHNKIDTKTLTKLLLNDTKLDDNFINKSGFVKLQYSNCYGTKPFFYLMIFIDKNTYYVPLCYYQNCEHIKSNFKQFYKLQKCTFTCDLAKSKLLLKCITIDDVIHGSQDNIMKLYHNLDDCIELFEKKKSFLSFINNDIKTFVRGSDEVFEICNIKLENVEKNEKNVRKYLSQKLIDNNNEMNKLIEYDTNNVKEKLDLSLTDGELNIDVIESNVKLLYCMDNDPFCQQLCLVLQPLNLNHTEYGYAYQMSFGGYNILLYNCNSILDKVDEYYKQIYNLIVSNNDIIKLKIKKIKNHIVLEDDGLIGEIRKIYTLTKNGKSADHLMVYHK